MTVRVEPLINGKVPPRISRRVLQNRARWASWFIAWIVLFLGVIGTIIVCNGGIANIRAENITIGGSILGVLLQIILTGTQWVYGTSRIIAYPSRAIDATLTAFGYGILFVPTLTLWIASANVPAAQYCAWGIVWVWALGFAWYPEHRLVGDK